ncbi:hypothetical protein [Halalkalicoccus ordinarius]|uniref:hypothetical protein n=1 Tax=Halalkalicoccus ordinarius TaxID=3116651 RepID=UPI00300F4188
MLDGVLHYRLDRRTADVEFETMTDRFAEDVAGAVVKGMPTDGRSLEDAIRVAFKQETELGREILDDRSSEGERIAR